jgi:hypothetical protein
MTLELGVEDSGAIPKAVLGSHTPHVRDKEDVPHEHAIPDLYGLKRGATLSEFLASVESERALRKELHDLINKSTDIKCTEDDEVWGLLLIHTRAKPAGAPNYVVEYLDVIMSDQVGDEAAARLISIEVRCAGFGNVVELEHLSFDRPHPQLDGSSSFKIIRYARHILEH